jgi:opacity protein-like surface antigen
MHPNTSLKIAALAAGILFAPLGALAQRLSFGVIGGGSLTDAFPEQTFPTLFSGDVPFPVAGERFYSPAKDYMVGGLIELRFNDQWSLEVDGMFRKLHMTTAAVLSDGSLNSVSPSPVITWEFPILAKYRFQARKVKPFVEAGPSFRTAGNLNGTDPSHLGITAGFGIETHWRNLKIAPAVRYTRWASDGRSSYSSSTSPNQVELLVGFSSEAESNWRPLGRRVSLGVVMGTNVTGDFSATSRTINLIGETGTSLLTFVNSSGPRSFIVGPKVELQLPYRLSVEVDALYRPVSSAAEQVDGNGMRRSGAYRYVTWEFPVLAKYKFPIRGLDPFAELGPAFRLPQSLTELSLFGVTAGAGVEFGLLSRLKIAPTIRYTHWSPDGFAVSSGVHRNQCEFLTGFSF